MMIILKAKKVNSFVSSVLFVFWYHLQNIVDTPHISNISRLRVNTSSFLRFEIWYLYSPSRLLVACYRVALLFLFSLCAVWMKLRNYNVNL
jgi:hypothetical protein